MRWLLLALALLLPTPALAAAEGDAATRPVRIYLLGDPQIGQTGATTADYVYNNARFELAICAAVNGQADLVIIAGDTVEDNAVAAQKTYFLDGLEACNFNTSGIPLIVLIGNHEQYDNDGTTFNDVDGEGKVREDFWGDGIPFPGGLLLNGTVRSCTTIESLDCDPDAEDLHCEFGTVQCTWHGAGTHLFTVYNSCALNNPAGVDAVITGYSTAHKTWLDTTVPAYIAAHPEITGAHMLGHRPIRGAGSLAGGSNADFMEQVICEPDNLYMTYMHGHALANDYNLLDCSGVAPDNNDWDVEEIMSPGTARYGKFNGSDPNYVLIELDRIGKDDDGQPSLTYTRRCTSCSVSGPLHTGH
ncbi:MAG: hypothetical protein GY737_00315 [Desulfobacteraceae bacterium]|nr:hypothetical protein [Desulfobacteraceae bacterium]